MRLVVPVALDGDRVILAQDGVRGHTYTCPVCGAEVRYRGGHGTHRIPHFYHVRSTNCPGGETALHAAAKHVLLDALNDPLRRRSLLLLEKPAACERPESHPEVRRPLPARGYRRPRRGRLPRQTHRCGLIGRRRRIDRRG